MSDSLKRIKGLFVVIDRRNYEGLKNWRNEMTKRDIPAVILLDDYTIENNAELIQSISQDRFDVGCCYNESPFWDMDYDAQHEIMSRIMDTYQLCAKKSLRLFGSKYFAYNENSLKIADKLGIPYIPARGTAGAKAVIYQPKEYKVKLISMIPEK